MMPRKQRDERAFSVVEVVIAALLIAVVIAGATAMFGGTQRSTSTTKVRDRQTTLANQVVTKLQADPSWATWCRTTSDPFDCNLQPWMASKGYNSLGNITDASGSTLTFAIAVHARGTDLPADGLGSADKDGVRPDVYRLSVSIAPHSSLTSKFPGIKPYALQAEFNPSNRIETGRVTVDACYMTNQVDERIPIADCYGQTSITRQLPPPGLDTSSTGSIATSCRPPTGAVGSDNRDCVAYKCADSTIATTPALAAGCSSYPGWKPPTSLAVFFTTVVMEPAKGSITLRDVKPPYTRYGPVALNRGRADFKNLPIGEFDVVPSITGSNRLWRSKSVPSTQRVTVEAGINSRAVLVFRPKATSTVSVPVRSVDGSVPWSPRNLTGWVSIDDNGAVRPPSTVPVEICLVPVPQGRLVSEDVPCGKFTQQASTTHFTFRNVEPGLYSAELSYDGYKRFLHMSGTAGYVWVTGTGVITKLNGSTAAFEHVNGLCAKNVRARHVGKTRNPVTGSPIAPVKPCSSPGGTPPPGGGGGGGTQ